MAYADKGDVLDGLGDGQDFFLVNFPVNKSTLQPQHRQFLEKEFAAVLNRCDPSRRWGIGFGGACSSTGSAAYNLTLSQARANAVLAHLRQKAPAINRPHFKTVTLGHGLVYAQAHPSNALPPKKREEMQASFRNVYCKLFDLTRPPAPPPRPDMLEDRTFEVRQVEQVSFNQSMGPAGVAGVALDINVGFEIKDAKGRIASYRYAGIGPSLGLPYLDWLAKGLLARLGPKVPKEIAQNKAVLWILRKAFTDKDSEVAGLLKALAGERVFRFLEEAVGKGVSTAKQVSKGPFQPFRNRGLEPRNFMTWAGDMQITSYGVVTNLPPVNLPDFLQKFVKATSNTILNFGGRGVVLPEMKPGYAAHVEDFDQGFVLFPGILQLTSTTGLLRFVKVGEFD